jgi:hypothetical protein
MMNAESRKWLTKRLDIQPAQGVQSRLHRCFHQAIGITPRSR